MFTCENSLFNAPQAKIFRLVHWSVAIFYRSVDKGGGTNVSDKGQLIGPCSVNKAFFNRSKRQQIEEKGKGNQGPAAVVMGYDYFGTVVNTAARLTDAGHGGQILISEQAVIIRKALIAHMQCALYLGLLFIMQVLPPSPPTGLVRRPPPWLVAIFWLVMVLYRPSPWSAAIFFRSVA